MPLVSIVCITYNHESYINDALDGFVMQKTDFPYEIIVHDDASTDGTANIIREFEAKYPELFVTILQNENQFSKKVNIWGNITFPKARGKYIALCEGDDYWTDPYKLQKQIDFLEGNPEYSFSIHAAKVLDMDTGKTGILKHKCKNGFRTFTTKDAILIGGSLITTNSMVLRSEFIRNIPEWFNNSPTGDFALSLILSIHGKVAYFDDVMSVYRRGVPGSWTNRIISTRSRRELHKKTEKMLLSFNKYTSNKYFIPVMQKILKNRVDLVNYNIHYVVNKIKNLK
jgi:glycosyltransferase involved in cell wall biosynthesis